LLLEAENEDSEDLFYWIDYVYEFGISHKIPKYDHMSFIKYHNIDVVVGGIAFVLFVLWMILKCLSKVLRWCCTKVVEDQDSKRDRPKKRGRTNKDKED